VPVSPSDSRPKKPHARALRIAAACVILLAIAGYVATQYVTSSTGPARCTVRSAGAKSESAGAKSENYEIKPEQAANAATITAVASQRKLPERAVTIALATAMQESSLRNIGHGDRDSLGLFQQRPSQGWGTEQQITDPVYSSGRFYDHLVQIPGYSRLPLTVAAQRVQHSGYPQAYAKHETNAALLTAALTGRRAAAFNCTTGPAGGDGKAGSATRVRERLVREFGTDVLRGEKARVPESASESASASASAEGVSLREDDGTGKREVGAGAEAAAGSAKQEVRIPAKGDQRGWELAHWAVANSAHLRVVQVSYLNRVWDASSSEEGWRKREDSGGSSDGGSATVSVRLAAGN
jgi:hypothetical protein